MFLARKKKDAVSLRLLGSVSVVSLPCLVTGTIFIGIDFHDHPTAAYPAEPEAEAGSA